MGKPQAPEPPDPRETSQAQTGSNVATALANTVSGNVNQIGPQGSMTYERTGSHQFTDPYTNQTYDLPTFTARTQLTPQQQRIFDTQQQAQQTMMNTADQQAARLQSHLQQDFSPDSLPRFGQIPNAPNLQSYGGDARLNDRFARGGNIQSSIGNAGNIINRDAQGGNIQSSVPSQRFDTRAAQGGDISANVRGQNFDTRAAQGGDITRTYGADDFSADRQRVEDALMERMQPQIDRDRASMDAQLANQGIGLGSRAFSSAQQDFSQGVNDARLGAILSAGQEQSRMVGMDRDRAMFENAAQQQAFGQDATNLQMQNAARQMQFQTDLAREQFSNQAQQQSFSQELANIQQANQARGQQQQADLALGQFANQAQQQAFGQDAANIAQRNAAQAQAFDQQATRGQFANQAQQQAFTQDAANLQMQNAARQAALDNQFRATGANNQNAQLGFGMDMQRMAAQDQQRQQALQQQIAMRNQPINEISALMSGSQVSLPQFGMNQPTPIPFTDNAGLINNQFQQQMGNYNAQMGAWNQTMGGLLGFGGSLVGAL